MWVFGGIARIIGTQEVNKHFTYHCDDIPEIVDKIITYVANADRKRRN